MSYMKKDEDADQGMIKVDRTSVFQEGTLSVKRLSAEADRVQHGCSTPHLSRRDDVGFF